MHALLAILALRPAFANDDGKTGVATTGCGDCHDGPSADTVAALAADRLELVAGETVNLTLTVTNAALSGGGLDVEASGGTLGGGSNNRLSSGEITHGLPQPMSGGVVVFDFTWTAPAEAGTYTIRGVGNAVNMDGEKTGDQWSFASDLALTVTPDTGGEGEGETAGPTDSAGSGDSDGADDSAVKDEGGCQCGLLRASPSSAGLILLGLGLVVGRRRR